MRPCLAEDGQMRACLVLRCGARVRCAGRDAHWTGQTCALDPGSRPARKSGKRSGKMDPRERGAGRVRLGPVRSSAVPCAALGFWCIFPAASWLASRASQGLDGCI